MKNPKPKDEANAFEVQRLESLLRHAQDRLRHFEERDAAEFSDIGNLLNSVKTPREAALVIVQTAQHLFGWDACSLDFIDQENGLASPILTMDTLDDVPVEVPPAYAQRQPSPLALRTVREGPQLILRDPTEAASADLEAFGNRSRRSAALMFVPIRHSGRPIGILSIQNYTPGAYDSDALVRLQSLADHSAGGIERIRIAASLDDSEARRKWTLEAARMGDWEWDIGTGQLRFSAIAEELHGLSPGGFAHTVGAFIALVHAEDAQRVHETIGAAVRSDTILQTEYRVILPGGRLRWLAATGRARYDGLDGSLTMLGLVWDITERIALQEQLLQARKMESVGRLAGGIAHDFNNLLTAILGFAALARDEIPAEHSAQPLLERVRQAGERAAELTKQLLAFARLQMVETYVLDLGKLVHEATALLAAHLGENVEIHEFCDNDPCWVRADSAQIEQVLVNLATNARDAMPKGGHLTLEARKIEISAATEPVRPDLEPGRYVTLVVRDTGCGMTEEVLNRLFEPFFSTKEVGKGAGLGLATCYGIIKQHGGRIWVESTPDSGTTFTVCLPAAEQELSRLPGDP